MARAVKRARLQACTTAGLPVCYTRRMSNPRSKPLRASRVAPSPEPEARNGRGIASRKRGPAVACLTSYVAPELARRLRVRAAEGGTTASAIVGEALARFLG